MQVPRPVSRREFMRFSGLAADAAGLALSTVGRAAAPTKERAGRGCGAGSITRGQQEVYER